MAGTGIHVNDPGATDGGARVLTTTPGANDPGLVVRPIGTQTISGAVTIADGADVALGATTDPSVNPGYDGSLIGITKTISGHMLQTEQNTALIADTNYAAHNTGYDFVGIGGVDIASSHLNMLQVDADGSVLATQGAAGATAWKVDGSGVTQPVSGTFYPATQPISGAVSFTAPQHVIVDSATLGTVTISGAVTQGTSPWVTNDPGLPDTLGQKTMANSTGVTIASDQASIPVAATLQASSAVVGHVINDASSAVIGHVIVDTAPTTAVTQSGTWTVQPGNTANTTAWKVDASSVAVPVTDNSGSLTVDAPVATPVFVRLSDGAAAITTLPVSLASLPALAAGSAVIGHVIVDSGAVTVTNATAANLKVAATLDAETTKVIGTVNLSAGQTLGTLSTITNVVHVDDNAGSLTVDNNGTFAVQAAATLAAETTKVIGVTRTADGSGNLLTSTGSALDVNIKTGNLTTLPVTNAGTFAVQQTRPATGTTSSPASVTTSVATVLAANAARYGATVFNESGAICYLKLGSAATLTDYTLQVAIGGYYEVPFSYTGIITGITSASTAVLRVTEVTT